MSESNTAAAKEHTINLPVRFDFTAQTDFRQAYESVASDSHFILNFSVAEYMDSSALGMLLLLRDYAGGDNAKIELTNCRAEIKNILEISNFQKLFKIN